MGSHVICMSVDRTSLTMFPTVFKTYETPQKFPLKEVLKRFMCFFFRFRADFKSKFDITASIKHCTVFLYSQND